MQRRSGGRGLGAVMFTDIVGSTAIAAEMGYRVGASTLEVTEIAIGAEVLGVAVEESTETTWVYLGEAVEAAG